MKNPVSENSAIAGSFPSVAIFILNWNGWEDTIECLESLRHLVYPNHQIIVFDNGSTDDSITKIKAWCEGKIRARGNFLSQPAAKKPVPWSDVVFEKDARAAAGERGGSPPGPRIDFVRCRENLGFAGGCNAGIRYALEASFEYIWLLNNDTIVDPRALDALVKTAENGENAGIVGSKVMFYEFPSLVQSLGSNRVLWPAKAVAGSADTGRTSLRVKWVYGTSLFARARTLADIGLFDERFFMYSEDKDLCLRAGKRGWGVYSALDSAVWHKWAASSNVRSQKKLLSGGGDVRIPWRGFQLHLYYETRNGIFLVRKNFPLFWLPYLLFRTTHLLIRTLLRAEKPFRQGRVIFKGTWDGVRGRMGRIVEPPLRQTAETK